MKIWIIVFISICLNLNAEKSDYIGEPSGLLTFSESIPLELSSSNEKALLNDQSRQKTRNQEIENEKTFPLNKVLPFLVFIASVLFLRYYPREEEKSKISIKTAEESATFSLEKLSSENLTIEEQYKNLIQIFRTFIEERFDMNAGSKTTEELLEEVKQKKISELSDLTLSKVLELSDLIKFAKTAPSTADYKRAHNLILQIIKL